MREPRNNAGECKTNTTVSQIELRQCTTIEKGKPPAKQPYYGEDAALYLTPDYLRGVTACDTVKPSTNAVHINSGDTILLWDGSNAGEVLRGRLGLLASTMTRVTHDARFISP
jgi:type I restriction enzyme S subunit